MGAQAMSETPQRQPGRPGIAAAHRAPANRGFTLIELMITAVIIAILAAIALPVYTNYIQSSRARTAGGDLVALASALENRFQRTLSYPVAADNSTNTTDTQALVNNVWAPAEDENFEYTAVFDGTGYILTATGTACTLTLDEGNTRTISGTGCGGLSQW
jgi:type IV pilus assembly protein PilE